MGMQLKIDEKMFKEPVDGVMGSVILSGQLGGKRELIGLATLRVGEPAVLALTTQSLAVEQMRELAFGLQEWADRVAALTQPGSEDPAPADAGVAVADGAAGFGARLEELLARRGRPRHGAGAYLANRYSVSTVTANAWLNGDHKCGPETARRIAEDHGSTFDWLYFGVPG